MEELIKQAFLHVEVIGPHVAEGHYDLVGPNGEIILPQVWETMVEPDWTITMHMWPMPEPPKPPDPPPVAAAAPAPPAAPAEGTPEIVIVEPKKEGAPGAPPPPPPAPMPPSNGAAPPPPTTSDDTIIVVPDPRPGKKAGPARLSPLLAWTAGRSRQSKSGKVPKKPEDAVQHDVVCRVM